MKQPNIPTTMDPPQVIAHLTAPSALTLGQILLLQKVDSPFLDPSRDIPWLGAAPSILLTAIPFEEAIKLADRDLPTLEKEAIQWANQFSREEWKKAIDDLQIAVRDFFGLLPAPSQEEARKNP